MSFIFKIGICKWCKQWAIPSKTIQPSMPYADSKVHGANMGPIWGRQDPGGPHIGPMNLAIWVVIVTWLENVTMIIWIYSIADKINFKLKLLREPLLKIPFSPTVKYRHRTKHPRIACRSDGVGSLHPIYCISNVYSIMLITVITPTVINLNYIILSLCVQAINRLMKCYLTQHMN